MIVNAEFVAGTSINEAESEALEFANKNQVWVKFMFNKIECNVRPMGRISSKLVVEYHDALGVGKKMIFN